MEIIYLDVVADSNSPFSLFHTTVGRGCPDALQTIVTEPPRATFVSEGSFCQDGGTV